MTIDNGLYKGWQVVDSDFVQRIKTETESPSYEKRGDLYDLRLSMPNLIPNSAADTLKTPKIIGEIIDPSGKNAGLVVKVFDGEPKFILARQGQLNQINILDYQGNKQPLVDYLADNQ